MSWASSLLSSSVVLVAWPFLGLSGLSLVCLFQLWGRDVASVCPHHLCCTESRWLRVFMLVIWSYGLWSHNWSCCGQLPPSWVGGHVLQALHRKRAGSNPVCLLPRLWPGYGIRPLWLSDLQIAHLVWLLQGSQAMWLGLSAGNTEQRQRWINDSYYYIRFVSFPLLNRITFDFRFAEVPNWLRNWLKTLLFNTLGFNLLSWHHSS